MSNHSSIRNSVIGRISMVFPSAWSVVFPEYFIVIWCSHRQQDICSVLQIFGDFLQCTANLRRFFAVYCKSSLIFCSILQIDCEIKQSGYEKSHPAGGRAYRSLFLYQKQRRRWLRDIEFDGFQAVAYFLLLWIHHRDARLFWEMEPLAACGRAVHGKPWLVGVKRHGRVVCINMDARLSKQSTQRLAGKEACGA